MRTVRVLAATLLAGLLVPATTVVASPAAGTAAQSPPTLVGIRAAHHPGFDRVVFDFTGGLPSSVRVRYVDRLIGDASGLPVRIAGQAILRVRFAPATAHGTTGPTAPVRRAFALPNVMNVVQAGDFEAVTSYGVGLARRAPVTVSRLRHPDRVVLDIGAAFATSARSVYFFDTHRFAANRTPFFVPRARPVPTRTPAVGLMDRIFAGVLPGERAAGLRLVLSGATGYADLRIANGIARVRLTGGCNAHGSTVTIAGEIMPTLRQLARVRWVKIYGPGGHTANPTGPGDSIPACLNP